MMKGVKELSEMIWEAKTIDMAISLAIKELNCKKEDLNIEILQEPIKGIFGMQRMAKIKAFIKDKSDFVNEASQVVHIADDGIKEIKLFIEKTLELMGINNFQVLYKEEDNNGIYNIGCDFEGLLIGKHGKTLESLQYLVNQIANRKTMGKNQRYLLDVGNYLKRHREHLEKIAINAAKKAKETKEEQQLTAMNSYDRKTIHLLLKDDPEISTYSVGEGNLRHIIVVPKNK